MQRAPVPRDGGSSWLPSAVPPSLAGACGSRARAGGRGAQRKRRPTRPGTARRRGGGRRVLERGGPRGRRTGVARGTNGRRPAGAAAGRRERSRRATQGAMPCPVNGRTRPRLLGWNRPGSLWPGGSARSGGGGPASPRVGAGRPGRGSSRGAAGRDSQPMVAHGPALWPAGRRVLVLPAPFDDMAGPKGPFQGAATVCRLLCPPPCHLSRGSGWCRIRRPGGSRGAGSSPAAAAGSRSCSPGRSRGRR